MFIEMSDYARNFVAFFSPSTAAPLLNLASLVEYSTSLVYIKVTKFWKQIKVSLIHPKTNQTNSYVPNKQVDSIQGILKIRDSISSCNV